MTNTTNTTNTTTYVLKGTDMNKGEYDFVTSCIFGNNEVNAVCGEYVAHLVEVYNEVPSGERVFTQPTFDINTVFAFNDNCTIGFFDDGEVDLCNELMMKNVSKYMSEEILLSMINEDDRDLVQDYVDNGTLTVAYTAEDLHGVDTYLLHDVSLDMEQLVFVSDCLISNLEKNGTDNGSPEYVQHLKEVHQEAKEADELFLLETRLPF